MERLKRSFSFWALLLAVVALLPAAVAGQGVKKFLFVTKITAAGKAVGASQFTEVNQLVGGKVKVTYGYIVATHSLPSQQVQLVWLAPPDNSWQIPLCQTGGDPEDDCEYAVDGNLYIDGSVVPTMLINAGVDGPVFYNTLHNGLLTVRLSNGTSTIGEGTYVQQFP